MMPKPDYVHPMTQQRKNKEQQHEQEVVAKKMLLRSLTLEAVCLFG